VPDNSDKTNSSVDGSLLQATVADAQSGQRLDRFLAAALPEMSRSRLQGLIASGAVARAGAKIGDGNLRVKPGEIYDVAVPPARAARPLGQDIPLDVVHEDSDLIVIVKPAGLVVHPAAGNPDGTLVNALIAHCGPSLAGVGGEARPGIVHRLDKDTSGLLVAAKNERAMRSLGKQFAGHSSGPITPWSGAVRGLAKGSSKARSAATRSTANAWRCCAEAARMRARAIAWWSVSAIPSGHLPA
jgi:23S rRNA pseudouridine1911/1915/1917 synthase